MDIKEEQTNYIEERNRGRKISLWEQFAIEVNEHCTFLKKI